MIQLQEVEKIYRKGRVEVRALRGIDLTVEEGEFIAIQGPSGSGKSTLLNIIGTLDFPTKGSYLFEGKNPFEYNDLGLARFRGKTIGFVFQEFNLLPHLKAWENISLPLIYRGVRSKKERKKKAFELLERFNLLDRAEHYPFELSGGEEQRIAILRALINNPRILLMDEPTGNIDSVNRSLFLEMVKELNQEGKTILIVTHADEVADTAKRRIRLKDGMVIDGS